MGTPCEFPWTATSTSPLASLEFASLPPSLPPSLTLAAFMLERIRHGMAAFLAVSAGSDDDGDARPPQIAGASTKPKPRNPQPETSNLKGSNLKGSNPKPPTPRVFAARGCASAYRQMLSTLHKMGAHHTCTCPSLHRPSLKASLRLSLLLTANR